MVGFSGKKAYLCGEIKSMALHMDNQEVIISTDLADSLETAIARCPHDKLFILTDSITRELCLPLIAHGSRLTASYNITIGATDENKNIASLSHVWEELQRGGATRHSLMVNLGGGMVTDLGGFAASTFKRGFCYINVPTTLLSMVDASVGGKTGINFGGLKNEIGVFSCPSFVILDTVFLNTLDDRNIRSGYAEMLKHGIISDTSHWADLLNFDLNDIDLKRLGDMVATSVAVKERIVNQDPTEKGIRKALNLGHTAGHAIESLALEEKRTVLHGYAVAWGLICELYLSAVKAGFPQDKLRQTVRFIRENYGIFPITCKEYDRLFEFMTHDKKNTAGIVNFTLMADIGEILIDKTASKEEIFDMLDFFREG